MVTEQLEFTPATFEIQNIWFTKIRVAGWILGNTGLGYWRRNMPNGTEQFRPTAIPSGVGSGGYSSEKECRGVCLKLVQLEIDWHQITWDNYKKIIKGSLRREYLEITRGADKSYVKEPEAKKCKSRM
jgi:hypothetical protein